MGKSLSFRLSTPLQDGNISSLQCRVELRMNKVRKCSLPGALKEDHNIQQDKQAVIQ